ncbi:Cystathionine gamma-synthase [Dimargaris verticillata]|uniref:Cystathionine gamma-synthase n=1 Tax=Dimargaris verticillata TaxID=2761393 RepID=A0A9W8B5R0_9FUNG|nr:Cystathionine gamma-synthase [Dimargaris verticillata]
MFEAKFAQPTERCLVLPSARIAEQCREFVNKFYSPVTQSDHEVGAEDNVRVVEYTVLPGRLFAPNDARSLPVHLYGVLFPAEAAAVAKLFWQHSGEIISSRLAEHCLKVLKHLEGPRSTPASPPPAAPTQATDPTYRDNKAMWSPRFGHPRYSRLGIAKSGSPMPTPLFAPDDEPTVPLEDASEYMEMRYGRNVDIVRARDCKAQLRHRIAEAVYEGHVNTAASATNPADAADNVYMFPTGMGAIFNAHRFLRQALGMQRQSACFGFPYTDTLKILQKFGPGCYFFGHGEDKDYTDLEAVAKEHYDRGEPLLAVFCECPGNPLLKTPDLPRLRALADAYGFAIVVDETIGSFVNINTFSYADVIVTSLTKVFSGDSNAMGGSLVLNPCYKYYRVLKQAADDLYEDVFWCEDAIFMERNSRTFRERVAKINRNAETLADFLAQHPLVDKLFYPKYTLRENYEQLRLPQGGYGGLLSLVLKRPESAQEFYNALCCAKGPSLGTNFTLSSPYTLLAHYTELEWAESYGVSRYLVRCSIGLEHEQALVAAFRAALDAVE